MKKSGKIPADLIKICFEFLLAVTLVCINIIRIFNVPITIDETGYQKQDTYLDLIQEKLGHANNHILHSIIRKFFAELFTDDLFFLRVDSLLAQIIYLIYSWLLSRHLFSNKWWQFCSFIILNISSPFLFSFWGLSRGYALSVCCMTISIYYLIKYIETKRSLFLSYSFIGAILSVYSNFSLINYFVTLCTIVILQNYLFSNNAARKGYLTKQIIILFVSVVLLAAMITYPLIQIYHFGELSFMGNNGFVNDTVKTLVDCGLYLHGPLKTRLVNYISFGIIISTCLSGLLWIITYSRSRYLKKETDLKMQYGIILFLLLFIPAISVIAQHLLFKINYITDRAALFFIPLFLLAFIYTLYFAGKLFTGVTNIMMGCLVLILIYNFTINTNLTYTMLWWFDADDLFVLKRIVNESKNKPGKIKIHTYWIFGQAMYYDVNKYYPGRFENPNWDNLPVLGKDTTYDFYYVVSSDNTDTLVKCYHRDTTYLYGGSALYKKN